MNKDLEASRGKVPNRICQQTPIMKENKTQGMGHQKPPESRGIPLSYDPQQRRTHQSPGNIRQHTPHTILHNSANWTYLADPVSAVLIKNHYNRICFTVCKSCHQFT